MGATLRVAQQAIRRLQPQFITQVSPTQIIQSPTFTSQAQPKMVEPTPPNPMPVLSKAGLADEKKVEELPKLSSDDFRIYNRIAVMMDGYVSKMIARLAYLY